MPSKETKTLQGKVVSETSCGLSCYSEEAKPACFKISACLGSSAFYKTIQKELQQLEGLHWIVSSSFQGSNKATKLLQFVGPVLGSCILIGFSTLWNKICYLRRHFDKEDSCIWGNWINPIKLFNMKPLKVVFMWLAFTFYASNEICQTAFQFSKMENCSWSAAVFMMILITKPSVTV